ncbi:hypothetical protein [Finegoldia magna]|uniref:hypothetical protein n=1 Tax=Finegoldia magna TaxID=1260 RepID=UPI002901F192|nr:hypothetical protein [Finegoldia magna]MDU1213052.1 hypothetical protein [Finegoldia magna]
MKILVDGRNHGAGTNSSSPCSTAGGGCRVYSSCKRLTGCGNIHVPVDIRPCPVKINVCIVH